MAHISVWVDNPAQSSITTEVIFQNSGHRQRSAHIKQAKNTTAKRTEQQPQKNGEARNR